MRRNVDTKTGLVNGTIGTVLSITVNHVTVQFHHISEPYKVEKDKSRFICHEKLLRLQETVSTNPSI